MFTPPFSDKHVNAPMQASAPARISSMHSVIADDVVEDPVAEKKAEDEEVGAEAENDEAENDEAENDEAEVGAEAENDEDEVGADAEVGAEAENEDAEVGAEAENEDENDEAEVETEEDLARLLKDISPLDMEAAIYQLNMLVSSGALICTPCQAGKNIVYSEDKKKNICIDLLCGQCRHMQAQRAVDDAAHAPHHICACGNRKFIKPDGTSNAWCSVCHKLPPDERPVDPRTGDGEASLGPMYYPPPPEVIHNDDGSCFINNIWYPCPPF